MPILLNQNGIAIVSSSFNHLLPKVWQAIQQNYFHHSYQNIYLNASKLQRWWRKAIGFYYGFKLIEPYHHDFSIPPFYLDNHINVYLKFHIVKFHIIESRVLLLISKHLKLGINIVIL